MTPKVSSENILFYWTELLNTNYSTSDIIILSQTNYKLYGLKNVILSSWT